MATNPFLRREKAPYWQAKQWPDASEHCVQRVLAQLPALRDILEWAEATPAYMHEKHPIIFTLLGKPGICHNVCLPDAIHDLVAQQAALLMRLDGVERCLSVAEAVVSEAARALAASLNNTAAVPCAKKSNGAATVG
jgi:hypothetical protein